MSKFFIGSTVLLFLFCGGGRKSFFSGSTNQVLDLFYRISSHPGYNEKESILFGLTNRIQNENLALKDYLQKRLVTDGNLAKIKNHDPQIVRSFVQELESIQNLGGLRIEDKGNVQFSFGDWTDLYSDGYSKAKLKNSSLIQKFKVADDSEILFFVRNHSGYQPVDFSFVGLDSQFFLFQGDGTLRYAKSDFADYSMRHEKFRDLFSKMKKSNPNSEIFNYDDFTLYYIAGATPIFYYIFLCLKILLLSSLIAFSILSFRELKEYNLKSANERELRKREVEFAKQILTESSTKAEEPTRPDNISEKSNESAISVDSEPDLNDSLEMGKKESVDHFIQKVIEEKTDGTDIRYSKIEKIS